MGSDTCFYFSLFRFDHGEICIAQCLEDPFIRSIKPRDSLQQYPGMPFLFAVVIDSICKANDEVSIRDINPEPDVSVWGLSSKCPPSLNDFISPMRQLIQKMTDKLCKRNYPGCMRGKSKCNLFEQKIW